MRYEEVKKYIYQNSPCPELNHHYDVHLYDNDGYIQLLEAAYRTYLETGLVKGQREFSTKVCGKTPSYISCMRARSRTPSLLVLNRILEDARLLHSGIEANKHFGQPYSENLNRAHGRLEALINTMEQVLVQV